MNIQQAKKENREWEKEFDEKFGKFYDIENPSLEHPDAGSEKFHYVELKSFIRHQIIQAEQRGREEGREQGVGEVYSGLGRYLSSDEPSEFSVCFDKNNPSTNHK